MTEELLEHFEPAIVYFHSEYWFNVPVPSFPKMELLLLQFVITVSYDEEALKYMTINLIYKVYPNGKYHLLDEDEYEQHESNELSA